MAFADLGTLGATGNTANNQATTSLVLINSIVSGDLVVVVFGVDNRVTGGGDDLAMASVTCGSNNLIKARQNASNLAAQAGASCSIWYAVCSYAVASGEAIIGTPTSAATSDATAVTGRRFSVAKSSDAIVTSTGATQNDASDPGTLTVTTTNEAHLRVRGIAGETSAAAGGLTVTTSWLDWDDGNSNATGTVAEIAVRCESIITTSTTGASDPTWSACDNASVYVTFREILRTPRDPIYNPIHNVITQ